MLSEVAGRGSFRAAAIALDYSPSAVSQQIALLEREAGVRLVRRGPRGAELTDAGLLLVRHADVALRELAKARRALDGLTGNGAARLRVAAFPTATATIVALAARSFAAASRMDGAGGRRRAAARARAARRRRGRRRGGLRVRAGRTRQPDRRGPDAALPPGRPPARRAARRSTSRTSPASCGSAATAARRCRRWSSCAAPPASRRRSARSRPTTTGRCRAWSRRTASSA